MARRSVLQIAFHGVLLVVLGMLVGLPFADAVTTQSGPEVERAWRVAHTGVASTGMTVVLVGLAMPYLVLSERAERILKPSLIVASYGFGVGLTLGGVIGVRGGEAHHICSHGHMSCA